MKRIIVFILSLIILFAFSTCKKTNTDNAGVLYGAWSKGTSFGDTLFFYQKDGKNMLSYQFSFNHLSPAPTETDYSYSKGNLKIRLLGPTGTLRTIESFNWKQYGQEFEIRGIDLYSFMSAYNVYFTFHKLY